MNQQPAIPPVPRELRLILAGLGGQGVIFTTRLLAQAAVAFGEPVMVSEIHGMSQRGGSVVSHLKIGGNESPLIRRGTADLLLALESDEALRNLPFLRPGGVAIVNTEQGPPPEVAEHLAGLDIQVLSVPATRIAVELGSAAVSNVVLVGFAAAHPSLTLPIDALGKALAVVARRRRELNLQALEAGCRAGQMHRSSAVPRELIQLERVCCGEAVTVATDRLRQSTEEAG
jgi:indolepyruvate ferredoxin oxidoreductase beta subunit